MCNGAFIRSVRNVFCKEGGVKPPTIKPLNHQTIKPYMPHMPDYIPETMVCQAQKAYKKIKKML